MTGDPLGSRVAKALATRRTDWTPMEIESVAGGLEFVPFAVRTGDGQRIFVRAGESRFSSNANDPHVDSRRLLQQEARIAEHLGGFGIPVAQVREVILEDDIDVLATDWVDDDDSTVDDAEVLETLARLHKVSAPAFDLVAEESATAAETVAARTARRLAVAGALANFGDVRIPSESILLEAATVPGRSLLHLDVRRANMRVRSGRLTALVDWTNALVGPPALEYARIAEYGEMQVPVGCFGGVPRAAELVFRLDAAVMLAVVFLSEAPSREDAARQLVRVKELLGELERQVT